LTIVKTAARYAAAGAALVVLTGCTDWAMYDVDVAQGKVPFLSTMRKSVRPDPYEYLRQTVPGTVPVQSPLGDVPPHFTQAQLDSAAATLQSPARGNAESLARGQVLYERSCSVCHGPAGAGDGQVVRRVTGRDGKEYGRFPFAPPINGAATAARADGYIYAVVAVGRGLMPSYGERLTHTDRWAVVEYVRELQSRAGAGPRATVGTPAAAAPQPAPAAPQNAPAAAVPPAGTR
jgi:mono/diheme cytochrome c family protein